MFNSLSYKDTFHVFPKELTLIECQSAPPHSRPNCKTSFISFQFVSHFFVSQKGRKEKKNRKKYKKILFKRNKKKQLTNLARNFCVHTETSKKKEKNILRLKEK